MSLTFSSATTATLTWNIGGAAGLETFQLSHGGGNAGMYYPPSLSGLGLMLKEENGVTIAHFAYYDGGGQPVWAAGSAPTAPNQFFYLYNQDPTNPQYVGNVSVAPSPWGFLYVNASVPNFELYQVPFYILAY